MGLFSIPALFMRGGTSKALVFRAADLPAAQADRDAIFLAAMGSPDGFLRQLDGMGGGVSSLSKVCVIGPPSRADADVDYAFAQVPVDGTAVDHAGNCGNMVSAMGPAALDLGLVAAPADGMARVRIHNTNTGKMIVARFPVEGGALAVDGDLAIDGVAGTAAAIRLDFLDPGGAKTGRLLPTGAARDMLTLPDGTGIAASLIDAANPCVLVDAADLGKTGTESPAALAADPAFMARMEAIRIAGSVHMGLAADARAAAALKSIPKVAIVARPADMAALDGRRVAARDMSLLVRMISMEQPHKAVPITGAICIAIACRLPGSLPHRLCAPGQGGLTLAHPSGTLLVDADVAPDGNVARSGVVYRTARKLFSGHVHYRL